MEEENRQGTHEKIYLLGKYKYVLSAYHLQKIYSDNQKI